MGQTFTSPNFLVSYMEFIITKILQEGSLAKKFTEDGGRGEESEA